MINVKKELQLPEGNIETDVSIFTEEDKKILLFIYKN